MDLGFTVGDFLVAAASCMFIYILITVPLFFVNFLKKKNIFWVQPIRDIILPLFFLLLLSSLTVANVYY